MQNIILYHVFRREEVGASKLIKTFASWDQAREYIKGDTRLYTSAKRLDITTKNLYQIK